MSDRKVYIYALKESGSDDVRYVGQTVDPDARLIGHLNTEIMAAGNPKRVWIEDVLDRGGKIELDAIDECSVKDSGELEDMWISYYMEQGAVLTNKRRATPSPLLYPRSESGSAFRVQLTTYLNKEQYDKWQKVKASRDESLSDAVILRNLIESEYDRLTDEPSVIADLLARVKALEDWKSSQSK